MTNKLLFAAMVAVLGTLSAGPARAEKFEWRLLEVDKCTLPALQDDDDQIILKCFAMVVPISNCKNSGGEVGMVGTRMFCRNTISKSAAEPLRPPPFFPDDATAAKFKPIQVPVSMYNGQKDPRAMSGK